VQSVLAELKRRNEEESGKRGEIDTLRRAMEEDRARMEAALYELNDRLKKEAE
jgi:hypothetical protein